MTQKEVGILLKAHNDEKLEQWQKTRLMMYAPIAANSTKPIKPQDILPLPGDEDNKTASKRKETPEEAVKRIKGKYGIHKN